MKKKWNKFYLPPVFLVTFTLTWTWISSGQTGAKNTGFPAGQRLQSEMGAVSGQAVTTAAVVSESDKKKPKFARSDALQNVKVATPEQIRESEKKLAKELAKDEAKAKAVAEKKKKAMQKKAALKRAQKEAKRPHIFKTVPANNEVKKYERYTLLTKWRQADLQKLAHTDKNGMRKVGKRYCVALGSYYTTTIGTEFDLIMADGRVIPCILGDVKSDQHTDAKHQRGNNDGCVAEFIVDDSKLVDAAKNGGSVHYIPEFSGEIKKIKIYTDSSDEKYFHF